MVEMPTKKNGERTYNRITAMLLPELVDIAPFYSPEDGVFQPFVFAGFKFSNRTNGQKVDRFLVYSLLELLSRFSPQPATSELLHWADAGAGVSVHVFLWRMRQQQMAPVVPHEYERFRSS